MQNISIPESTYMNLLRALDWQCSHALSENIRIRRKQIALIVSKL
jgi:hypothetical protein